MSGAEPVAAPESPGRILRSARQASGLSTREIAAALNLLESVVIAIEEDDTPRQPEAVFMRGYVRNYARLLKLDPEPLVGAIGASRQPAPVEPVQAISESPRWIWPAAAVGAALAVLVGVVIHLLQPGEMRGSSGLVNPPAETSSGDVPDVENTDPPPIPEDVADSPNPEKPADPQDALIEVENDDGPESKADPAVTADPVDPATTGSTDSAEIPSAASAEPVAGEIGADSLPTVEGLPTGVIRKRMNPGKGDTIRLSFTADCWVRVKDTTGRRVFSDMGRRGVEFELTGGGPFDVLLGFAPAATLEWNGEAIALQPHMRNNVATLLLDRAAEGVADKVVNGQES